jgi:hypothetical protein
MNSPSFDSNNLGSMVFNGTNHVNFGNNSALYDAYNTYFTQEFVIKVYSDAETGKTILRVDDFSRIHLMISITSISFIIGYSSPVDTLTFTTTIEYYKSYYVSFVWSKLQTQQIYVNGILVAERIPNISSYTGVTGTSGGANIGRGHSSPFSTPLVGSVSQFRHYNRPLTSTEILQNFNAVKGRYGI